MNFGDRTLKECGHTLSFFIVMAKRKKNINVQISRVLLMVTPIILISTEIIRVIFGGDLIPISYSLEATLLLWMEAFRRQMCLWYHLSVVFIGLMSLGLLAGPVIIIVGGAILIKVVNVWRGNTKRNGVES